MKRLWDSARAERPSIFEQPKQMRFDKYLGRSVRLLDVESFKVACRKFVAEFEPEVKNPSDLNCCLSKMFRGKLVGKGPFEVDVLISSKEIKFQVAFSIFLLLRQINLELGVEDATGSALKIFEKAIRESYSSRIYTVEGFFVFNYNLISAEISKATGRNFTREDLNLKIMPYLMRQELEVMNETKVQSELIGKLADSLRARTQSSCLLGQYPVPGLRLMGILSENHNSHFQVWGFERGGCLDEDTEPYFVPLGESAGPGYIQYDDLLQMRTNFASVILMTPWEADHLLKAAEIRRRGIDACEPFGRLMVDDVELALFRWLHGERLAGISKAHPWFEYGKVVGTCHAKGIALDDAAGRNAVWTGERIRILDFEHTWMTDKPEPLGREEREIGLDRVHNELEGRRLREVFMEGYESV